MINKFGLLLLAGMLCLYACRHKEKEQIARLVSEWQNKEIIFPPHSVFTYYGEDITTHPETKTDYKILVYADSAGCLSCKFKFMLWYKLIEELDSLSHRNTSCLFYIHSDNYKEVRYILKRDGFDFPVCFDKEDELNRLNHFPAEMMFQTFLLDSSNRVIAIGNPILNPQVKDLYLKIITGDKTLTAKSPETAISLPSSEINMGLLSEKDTSETVFHLSNTGEFPLIVKDIVTSCGCTSVEYKKQPVKKGGKLQIKVKIKPDSPGFFEKTLSVYCNTPGSPVKLTIKGRTQ